MGSHKVTVAIPVYNGMPHIKEAVESVLNQTYEDVRLVIIDDGSSDGTSAYLETLRDNPRVVLSPNPQNLGVEGAWNRALDQAADSEYFKMVCADDFIYPTAIAKEVAALDANPDAVMTASRRTIIDDSGKTIIKARGLAGLKGKVDGRKAVKRSVACGTNILGEPTSVMLRSSALTGLRFSAEHKLLIDFDMWAQVLQRGSVVAIREPLAVFRVGALSDSLKTISSHRHMQAGQFRKMANDPAQQIGKVRLQVGVAMASGIAYSRKVFYKLLNVRSRITKTA